MSDQIQADIQPVADRLTEDLLRVLANLNAKPLERKVGPFTVTKSPFGGMGYVVTFVLFRQTGIGFHARRFKYNPLEWGWFIFGWRIDFGW